MLKKIRWFFVVCTIFLGQRNIWAADSIHVIKIEGVINPVISAFVKESLIQAEQEKASALIIELDTPGGLLDATRDMIGNIINSELPVVTYVTPRGARATSAGVFIMMAADVAAMAPETHLGAAHPVTITGEGEGGQPAPSNKKGNNKPKDTSAMSEKMVSDAAAYIRTLANERGRNAEWAERAVRESVSLTSEEAVKEKVIDLIAVNQQELLEKIHDRKILKNKKEILIKTKGFSIKNILMSPTKKLLHKLAHPNVAYILMTIGIYGLIYELASPGIGLGGGVGIICLLLAFFSLQVLPINTVGAALILVGFVLLFIDLISPSHGLLTFAGLISFAIGSFMLIDVKSSPGIARVSIELIASTVGATALFFGYGLKKVFEAKKAKPKVGVESLIGSIGTAETDIEPRGTVFLNGELWSARSETVIKKGEEVSVAAIEGNTLIINKK